MSIAINSFSSINSMQIEKHSKPKFNQSLKNIESEASVLTKLTTTEQQNQEKIAGSDDWWTSERMKNAQPLKWYEGEAPAIAPLKTETRGTSTTQPLTAEGSAETASVALNRRKTAANVSGWARPRMQSVKPLTWYESTLAGVISNNTSIDTSI